MKYKAIILDLDDTLYDYASLNDAAIDRAVTMAHDKCKVPKDSFMDAFLWARGDTKKILNETGACHNRMLYFQKALEHLGLPPVISAIDLYECYWGYMLEHMQLNYGVLEFIQYCKYHSAKIGICSDLTAHIQHRKIRRLGIAHLIDAIVTSEEAGVEKPHLQMFGMILSKLGVAASEALYIGDSYKKDIVGAECAGIDVLWYKGKEEDRRSIATFSEALERLM